MPKSVFGPTRRNLLMMASAGAASLALPFPRPALAQAKPIKVGLLLPYSGTYAQLGEAITRAMELVPSSSMAASLRIARSFSSRSMTS